MGRTSPERHGAQGGSGEGGKIWGHVKQGDICLKRPTERDFPAGGDVSECVFGCWTCGVGGDWGVLEYNL